MRVTACVLFFFFFSRQMAVLRQLEGETELRDGGWGEAGVFPSSSLLFKSFVPGDPSVHVAQEGGWMLLLPLL